MTVAANFILFQIGWFACVLGAANGYAAIGTAVAVAIVTLHVLRAARPPVELALILIAAVLGGAWDSVLAALDWFRYHSGVWLAPLAPHWMIALWMVFATTLNVSLRWLKTRPLLAAMLGAAGGPAAYYAGHALGAVGIPDLSLALAAQGLGWALLLPGLVWASRCLDGMAPAKREGWPCLS